MTLKPISILLPHLLRIVTLDSLQRPTSPECLTKIDLLACNAYKGNSKYVSVDAIICMLLQSPMKKALREK